MAAEFRIGRGQSIGKLLGFIQNLNLEHPWIVTVERPKNSRSLRQNRLYQKWLGIIAQETGSDRSAIRNHCLGEFLDPVVTELNGKITHALRSTTDLNVHEMADYMSRVQAWAASDLGVNLPIPEEMHEVRK